MGLFNKKNKKVEVKTNSVVANNPKLSSQKTNKKQKKILLSCGSGIVTSTIARKKVEELLKNDLRVRSFVDNVVSKL